MSCETVVIWGKNGCGKTTVAVNLACALGDKGHMVGIISSNLYFGELQIHLNSNTFDDKGLHKSFSDSSTKINEQFIESRINKNIFTLSVPNKFDSLNNTEVSARQAGSLIEQAEIYFDYLIIDGNAELQNPVTYIGMGFCKNVFIVIRPSITTCLWYSSVKTLCEQIQIDNKLKFIQNAYDNSCDISGFIEKEKITFSADLPYIHYAPVYENSGKPIYFHSDKLCDRYKTNIEKMIEEISKGVV